MRTSPATKAFLTTLVQELEQAGCFPVLLRNHETFPEEIGNDLDIFVRGESLYTALSILRDGAARQGGGIGHVHRRGYFVAVWLRFPDSVKPVHVDLYHGALTWHGQRFLGDDELVRASRMTGDTVRYRIPAQGHEALVSLLASILWGGFFKVRYQDHLHELISSPEEKERFTASLEKSFAHDGNVLAQAVSRKEASLLVTSRFSTGLRWKLMIHGLLSTPLESIQGWLEHWIEEATCYLTRRPGTVVEYHKGVFTPAQLDEVRERLGDYYGDTREMRQAQYRLKKLAVAWRLRGKNHLVMQESDRFAINGIPWLDSASGPEGLIGKTLETLSGRIHLQYS